MRSVLFGLSILLPSVTFAGTLFEADFEGSNNQGAIPYLKGTSKHSGGGYFSFLGGEIVGGALNPGDGTQDYSRYNNVVLDNSSEAQGSTSGSRYALKTQYKAGYAHSFQLNTSIVTFPEVNTVYVRWYQKWSSQWSWPSDQQKLLKILGPEQSQNYKIAFGKPNIVLTKRTEGTSINETYVFPEWSGLETLYRLTDSSPSTGSYSLQPGKWYCIEAMVKSNTPGKKDAEFRYWIDDQLKLELTNTENRGTSSRGITNIELQHVYQLSGGSKTTKDMPTWMDNIVVSTTRVGCGGPANSVNPPAPPFLKVSQL